MGYCREVTARLMGMTLDYDVAGHFEVYEACPIRKARQENVNKEWKDGSVIAGEGSMWKKVQSKEKVMEALNFGR